MHEDSKELAEDNLKQFEEETKALWQNSHRREEPSMSANDKKNKKAFEEAFQAGAVDPRSTMGVNFRAECAANPDLAKAYNGLNR